MIGIELGRSEGRFAVERRVGHKVTLACRRRGVVLRNIADVVVVMPAPAMSEDLAIELCRVVKESIDDVARDEPA
jgi:adenosylmethionine-8-amino-7-oxononanoate aminotransferase